MRVSAHVVLGLVVGWLFWAPSSMAAAGDVGGTVRVGEAGMSKSFEFGEADTIRVDVRLGSAKKFGVKFEFADGKQDLLQAKLEGD